MQEINTSDISMVTGAGVAYEVGRAIGEAARWAYDNVLMTDGWLDAINPYNP